MPNFWEAKDLQHWAHGFLICGAAQTSEHELHASFPRSGKLPHLSIYSRGRRDQKVAPNLQFRGQSPGLSSRDRETLVRLAGLSTSEMNAFLQEVRDRHLSLNPPIISNAPRQTALKDSDFPALGGSPDLTLKRGVVGRTPPPPTPAPILTSMAAPITPADLDPIMAEFNKLSPQLQSVLRMSGAFD